MTRTSERLVIATAALCFVGSGASALIYETVWTQQFGAVFGTSAMAVTAVLGAYMLGLAAGALAARRWVHLVRRPMLAYALAELLIGALALTVDRQIALAASLQQALFSTAEPAAISYAHSGVFFLLAAFLILLLPTALMGATLPLLARFCVRNERQIGARISLLYGTNTLGAVIGVLAAGFFLIPNFGLSTSVSIAAAINVLVGVLAVLIARVADDAMAAPPVHDPTATRWSPALVITFLSGFVALGFEIIWMRLLAHLLGGAQYSFAAMLATFLIGLAAGAAIARPLCRSRRRAAITLVASQVGVAAAFLGSFALVDEIAAVSVEIDKGSLAFLWSALRVGAATILPGALFLGVAWPAAVRVAASDAQATAPAASAVLAWNTLGAICGVVVTGLILLPTTRVVGATHVLCVIAVCSGAFGAWTLFGSTRLRWAASAMIAAAILVSPTEPWATLRTQSLIGQQGHGEVVFYQDGRSADVMVLAQPAGYRLSTNGLPESMIRRPGSMVSRQRTARWLSVLPATLHPDPRSIMIVGFGAGHTVDAVPQRVPEIVAVELEPAVIEANRALTGLRRDDPLADPRLQLVINDARSALNLADRRYDIIVSQPSHPWTDGASHLFTSEFYALAASRLNQGGMFVQWISRDFVDEPLLRTMVATLRSQFSSVELFVVEGTGIVLLAGDLRMLEPDSLAAAFERDPAAWALIGVPDAATLLAARWLDGASADRFSAGAAVSHDGRNLMRIEGPRVLNRALGVADLQQGLAPYDAITGLSDSDLAVAIIHALQLVGESGRARTLASEIADPERQAVAMAMIEPGGRNAAVSLSRMAREGNQQAVAVMVSLRPQLLATRDADQQALLDTDPLVALLRRGSMELQDRSFTQFEQLTLPALLQVRDWGVLRRQAVTTQIRYHVTAPRGDLQRALSLNETLIAEQLTPQLLLQRMQIGLSLRDRDVCLDTENMLASTVRFSETPAQFRSRARLVAHQFEQFIGRSPRWRP